MSNSNGRVVVDTNVGVAIAVTGVLLALVAFHEIGVLVLEGVVYPLGLGGLAGLLVIALADPEEL